MKERFFNHLESIKNDDAKVKLFPLFLICLAITSVFGYVVLRFESFDYPSEHNYILAILFVGIVVLSFVLETTFLYFLTPKTFTYKMSCILTCYMFLGFGIIVLFNIPLHYICPQYQSLIMDLISALYRVCFIMIIKKVYCPPKFKRIYLLILFEITSLI